MCGIVGTVNQPLDPQVLDLLAHRGPDASGLSQAACGSHRVYFGHRRLAIVDLSENGAQPMASDDGRHLIAFNGEIYNHQDIRRELGDTPFRGHSDTETLLEALRRFGLDILEKLNGIFAFAYLDTQEEKLLLVRDPFGVKPLYYGVRGDCFCFASEIAPLRRMIDTPIDTQSLATLLKLRFLPSPATMYQGIRRLRPGHALEVDLGGNGLRYREHAYLPAGRHMRPRFTGGFQAALDQYSKLFQQAVERQLMSDVEVGILLSGGIDSALVAVNAQKRCSYPLKAFTVGFDDASAGEIDETKAAAETARIIGLQHHTVRVSFDDFLEVLQDTVRAVEEPSATTSIVPMRFLSKLAGDHVKVVLSGQGADELLGGYARYQGELWHGLVPPALARAADKAATAVGVRNDTLRRGFRTLGQRGDISRFLASYEVFSDAQIADLTGATSSLSRETIQYLYDSLHCRELGSSVERMMSIDARFGLSDDLLLYTDKITMQESLECRVPFLDTDLAAFVESLPYDFRIRIGKTKIIHKAFAERTLPAAIVHRRKFGFQSPTRQWFRDKDALGRILLDSRSCFAQHFNLRAVEAVIDEHRQRFNRERQIFLLLSLALSLDGDNCHYASARSAVGSRALN